MPARNTVTYYDRALARSARRRRLRQIALAVGVCAIAAALYASRADSYPVCDPTMPACPPRPHPIPEQHMNPNAIRLFPSQRHGYRPAEEIAEELTPSARAAERERLQRDINQFLAAGNQATRLPPHPIAPHRRSH